MPSTREAALILKRTAAQQNRGRRRLLPGDCPDPSYAKMTSPLGLHRVMKNRYVTSYLSLLGLLGLAAWLFQTSVSQAQRTEHAVSVWVEESLSRVQPTTPAGSKKRVEIAASRNEVESFQVIVSSSGPKLEGVTAFVSDLSDGAGHRISNCTSSFTARSMSICRNPSPHSSNLPAGGPIRWCPF